MRKCKSCEYQGSPDSFPNAGIVKGIQYYRHVCKACYQIQKSGEASARRDIYRKYKSTLECEHCGFNDPRALQFHHTDSDKEFDVSDKASSMSLDTLKVEIGKCKVLCANCHMIEHSGYS